MRTEKIDRVLEILLYILIFITPISRSGVEIFTFLLIIFWIYKKIKMKIFFDGKYDSLKKLLIIYVIVNTLTLINAVNLYEGISSLVGGLLQNILTFIIALEVLKNEKHFKNVLKILPITAFLVFSYGVYEKNVLNIRRTYLTFSNPNPAGTYVMMSTLLFIAFLIWYKQVKYKSIFAILTILGSIVLIYTGSRGAILGYLAGFLGIVFIFIKEYNLKKYWKVLVVLFIMMILIINFVPDDLIYRFTSLRNLKTVEQRLFMYKTGYKMFLDHPILGIGRGQFRYTYPSYKPQGAKNFTHIHSFFIHLPVAIGITGFLMFLFILKKVLIDNAKEWKGNNPWLHYGVIIIVIGAAVHNLFDWTFMHCQVGIYLVIMTAMWLNNINYSFSGGDFD